MEKLNDEISCMQELREYIISRLPEGVVAKIPVKCAPHIINITLPKIRSETALHALSARGVFVSSGSACASNSTHKASRALLAFGVSEDEADSSLRISLCPDNTKEQADILLDALREAVAHLARK